MTLEKEYKRNLIILIILLSLVFFAFAVFSILLVIVVRYNDKEDNSNSNLYEYNEITTSLNQSSGGFVRIKKEIKNEEYISYLNDYSNSLVFITNFGGREYECTGSCHCRGKKINSGGRRNANILNKGLFVLLTALSTTIALNIAKESFQHNCEEKYSEICKSENKESSNLEVDDLMDDIDPLEIEAKVENCEVVETKKAKISEVGTHKIECEGHCVSNMLVKGKTAQYMARKTIGECETLILRRVFHVPAFTASSDYLVKVKFSNTYLEPFCWVTSFYTYDLQKMNPIGEQKMQLIVERDKKAHACVGSNKGHQENFYNVNCRRGRLLDSKFEQKINNRYEMNPGEEDD